MSIIPVHTGDDFGYAEGNEVVNLRVYHDPYEHGEETWDWSLDGIAADGRYTEGLYGAPTVGAIIELIPQFCEEFHIPQGLPIQICGELTGDTWEWRML